MIIIGLTGSIGMGKTTVAQMLREMNIPVHSADQAVHELLSIDGAAVEPIAKKFPESLKEEDGKRWIDRKILGSILFKDDSKRKAAEKIIHPLVHDMADKFTAEMRENDIEMVVLDIPLLFEVGAENRVDTIFCVSAPEEVQKERVMARAGMTEEKFEAIKASQMPDEEKRKRSNVVIDTGCDQLETRAQLEEELEKVMLSEVVA